ncbi:hypothetical protein MKW98_006576 [Papaver atlanticum]|uniref:Neprosin PEP catalytic domain-containing protein n=1 Tax=Papaver atlanticum TaxID=357466 RepID=A0AAD4T9H1_9MAGN|nr:hypothetical protein MKW98_006576 [Papaver atlanticum]
MGSGDIPDDRYPNHAGYFADIQYKNQDDGIRKPDNFKVQFTVDCKESMNSLWDDKHVVLHYGGPGGGTCA